MNRLAPDLKRMGVNVRVNRPPRRPLGGRVFSLFPWASFALSIGNTAFGSSWEPMLWSVTPFPQELLLIIWSLAQEKRAQEHRFPMGPYSRYRNSLMESPAISSCIASGRTCIPYDKMSDSDLKLSEVCTLRKQP
jgi:hypothetical protein